MRTALSFQPASRETKKNGCTYPGSHEIEIRKNTLNIFLSDWLQLILLQGL